jgi:hypothetical protein
MASGSGAGKRYSKSSQIIPVTLIEGVKKGGAGSAMALLSHKLKTRSRVEKYYQDRG